MSPPKQSPGELFLNNWAAIARAVGILIGLAEMTAGFVQGPQAVSAEVLAFAGGLLVAPNIAGAQTKRNGKR